jgi:hypothetical protein
MRAPTLKRAGFAAAAAVIATAGAMTTATAASAASAATRQPTHLSIATKAAVEHHQRVTVIGGRLTSHSAGLPDRLVFLVRMSAKDRPDVVGRERTGRFGAVGFAVSPKLSAHYLLAFPGGSTFLPSRSVVVTVKD